MATVRLKHLHKSYDRRRTWAVKDVTLEIADGEFMALLGPSGCGKSSTMRMIAGLEELTGGEIWFNDTLMNRIPPKGRNVAMVFESYALYPTLNVYENLAFPLRSAGTPNDEVQRRIREIVNILQCEDLLDLKPANLSSGQSQLVGLGRALMRKPNVFIMDEPISHLDTRLRSRMRSYIKRLHIELGYTMLYVTHDQEEAMALADRIAIMDMGQVVQIGTPSEVFHQPMSRYVAGFIGEPPMNFLECHAEDQGGNPVLSYRGHHIPLENSSARARVPAHIPRDVVVGIRPFYVSIAQERSATHSVPAEVFVVEPMGDTTVVTFNTDDTRIQIVFEQDLQARSGDVLWLGFDPAHLLLFDKDTGSRLG